MKPLTIFFISGLIFIISGCCKHKPDIVCNPASLETQPFIQRFAVFSCGSNDYDYTYIARRKEQIDSLTACTFSPPVAFPIDETGMVYIMFGKMSYYYNDTFASTHILKDTCSKKLVYEVNMVQRDTTLWSNGGGVLSMFCSVENVPADYQVEVKYKYIPIQ